MKHSGLHPSEIQIIAIAFMFVLVGALAVGTLAYCTARM